MNLDLVGKKVSINGGGSTYLVRATTQDGQTAIVSLCIDPQYISTIPIADLTPLNAEQYDPRPCPHCGESRVYVIQFGPATCEHCHQTWHSHNWPAPTQPPQPSGLDLLRQYNANTA